MGGCISLEDPELTHILLVYSLHLQCESFMLATPMLSAQQLLNQMLVQRPLLWSSVAECLAVSNPAGEAIRGPLGFYD